MKIDNNPYAIRFREDNSGSMTSSPHSPVPLLFPPCFWSRSSSPNNTEHLALCTRFVDAKGDIRVEIMTFLSLEG